MGQNETLRWLSKAVYAAANIWKLSHFEHETDQYEEVPLTDDCVTCYVCFSIK